VKRPVGRPICKWIDNIKLDLVEIGLGGVDWVGVAQNKKKWKSVHAVMYLWETTEWLHYWWLLEYCSAPVVS
jgi:hypothetical protein